MNIHWKQLLFWTLLAVVIFYYLLLFGVFVFVNQEEMQLFIPAWWSIRDDLLLPGGFCEVVGQWLIQYYRQPMSALVTHTTLLVSCGWFVCHFLRKFSEERYMRFLSLVPVVYLLKMIVLGDFLIDGLLGAFLLLGALCFLPQSHKSIFWAGYGLCMVVSLFFLAGLVSVYYALLYVLFSFFFYSKNQGLASLPCGIVAIFICLYSDQLGVPVPLCEGWRPEEYLEVQRLPLAYSYHVWGILAGMLIVIGLFSFIIQKMGRNQRMRRCVLGVAFLFAIGVIAVVGRPERWQMRRIMHEELAFLANKHQWKAIIDKCKGKAIPDYVTLNYLNMALSKEGLLADQAFCFDQQGVKGLCADWDHTFYMDRLLSDLHYYIGDLSFSESYAMDGFTQAKRQGSSRMMRRMLQLSLLKGEVRLARKYMNLLALMPYEQAWVADYQQCLEHPERMKEMPDLKNKVWLKERTDDPLALSVSLDSLWTSYTYAENRVAWEYAGCYYLLNKDLSSFRHFLMREPLLKPSVLPIHFQEALLLREEGKASGLFEDVDATLAERYQSFQTAMKTLGRSDMVSMYKRYGNTYWFYYYFKVIK